MSRLKPSVLLFSMAWHHRVRLFWGATFVGLFAYGLCLATLTLKWMQIEIPLAFHGLLGVPVGLLLVFRTNTAYDRWWEGRRLLGELVNVTRFLALKLDSFMAPDDSRRLPLAETLGAFARTMTEHLAMKAWPDPRPRVSPPLANLEALSRQIEDLRRDGVVAGAQTLVLEDGVRCLTNILGGCERIKSTPMPIAYSLHLEIIVLLYVLLIPFGIMTFLKWWTVPLVMLVFYILEGIQFIGEEIEDPFGDDPNDLAGFDIARNIGQEMQGILVHDLPHPAGSPVPAAKAPAP